MIRTSSFAPFRFDLLVNRQTIEAKGALPTEPSKLILPVKNVISLRVAYLANHSVSVLTGSKAVTVPALLHAVSHDAGCPSPFSISGRVIIAHSCSMRPSDLDNGTGQVKGKPLVYRQMVIRRAKLGVKRINLHLVCEIGC
jgi:hypothetical protein